MTFQEWEQDIADKIKAKNPIQPGEDPQKYAKSIEYAVHEYFEKKFPGDTLNNHQDSDDFDEFLADWEEKHKSGTVSSGNDIPYGSKNSRVLKIQQHMSTDDDYLVLLQYGSNKFGRTEKLPEWSATDGLFGPRTDDAIRVFLSLHTKLTKDAQAPITPEIEKAILSVTPETDGSFPGADQASVGRFAQALAKDPNAPKRAFAESISYKKDLLSSTKNRHKQLEKLVFERLVKNVR